MIRDIGRAVFFECAWNGRRELKRVGSSGCYRDFDINRRFSGWRRLYVPSPCDFVTYLCQRPLHHNSYRNGSTRISRDGLQLIHNSYAR